jgi:hypothetical protein
MQSVEYKVLYVHNLLPPDNFLYGHSSLPPSPIPNPRSYQQKYKHIRLLKLV